MTRKVNSNSKRVGIGEQIAWIGQRWGSTWKVERRGTGLVAIGTVRPDPITREYTVRLTYDGAEPRVYVTDPPLLCREDAQRIPHTYEGNRLCLFRPKYRDWTAEMLLADTIILWISEWLYWYEIWFATGDDWRGGGEHPAGRRPAPRPTPGL